MKKYERIKRYIHSNRPVLNAVPVFIAIAALFAILSLSSEICIFKNITGLPCPGCGMTRAYMAILKLDIKAAFFYHPLFLMPVFILMLVSLKNFNKKIYTLYRSDALWLALIIITLSVWAIRMIFMFPSEAPMDLNRNAVLFKIIAKIILNVKII